MSIPIIGGELENENMNALIKRCKVISVDKQLISAGSMPYWSFCIQYLDGDIPGRNLKYPEKVDYRTVLTEEVFKRFATFREIRKQIAQAEALPAFAIFNDAELAEMAKLDVLNVQSMKTINGIGDKKIEKYGSKFISA